MNKEYLKNFLSKGAEIASSAIGGAIGLMDGPASAIFGGVLGTTINMSFQEIIKRQLSNRQEIRIAASTTYVLDGINNRIENKENFRKDFFSELSDNRSSAQELFEGVLIKCKNEYQEKKIRFISNIFETTIFDQQISSETANEVLSIAEKYTYRKICIISFFNRKNEFDSSFLMNEPYSWYENARYSIELEILKQNIFELGNDGILDQNNIATFTKEDIVPYDYKLTTIGVLIFNMMNLQSIPFHDIEPIYNELIYKEEFGINNQDK